MNYLYLSYSIGIGIILGIATVFFKIGEDFIKLRSKDKTIIFITSLLFFFGFIILFILIVQYLFKWFW